MPSPEFKKQLDALAGELVTPERFSAPVYPELPAEVRGFTTELDRTSRLGEIAVEYPNTETSRLYGSHTVEQ